jgi:protein farnesyltransferase subunit beta
MSTTTTTTSNTTTGLQEKEDDGYPTHTSKVQEECQNLCMETMASSLSISESYELGLVGKDNLIKLLRERHVGYSQRGLNGLKGYMKQLDASRPWLIYWMLHSLALLNAFPNDKNFLSRVVSTLRHMSRRGTDTGGYGGGPQQLPHCAPTYAAVLSLLTVGTKEAYQSIDRPRLYRFYMSMKQKDGSFTMHEDGETDTRAVYTVLCVCSLLNMLTPELTDKTGDWICSCQTFEGGFGAEPFNEAHGGYAFCAVACLALLNQFSSMDTKAVLRWITLKQMPKEGGFQGRSNKLVDSCYSFWQGSIPAILLLGSNGELKTEERLKMKGQLIMDQEMLQKYLLTCCQQTNGGMRDKPGKGRDNYHTCYALSGLSIAQHYGGVIYGDSDNQLEETHPIYNIRMDKVNDSKKYFYGSNVIGGTTHEELMLCSPQESGESVATECVL